MNVKKVGKLKFASEEIKEDNQELITVKIRAIKEVKGINWNRVIQVMMILIEKLNKK